MKKMFILILTLLFGLAGLFANAQQETETAAKDVADQVAKAKYVFLFIGDGMALPQINSAEAYMSSVNGTPVGVKQLAFTRFPAQGMTTTYDALSFITDSASAGTAIASGNKTESGVINYNVAKTEKFTTIAELAKNAGMKVGILSSVNLDHATPASFYAKEQSRNNYYNISMQMADSDFDYFAGGLVRLDKTPKGEKSALDVMKERGWQIASTREELNALTPGTQAYAYYGTSFTTNSLDYAMDQEGDDVSLSEYVQKGIELLENEKGFFMMVEGGKIDWACHANDAAASIKNTIAFDDAIQKGIDFYNAHPDETVIIVTGDHETGGLTLGFAGTKYGSAFDEIGKQKMSYEAFDAYVIKPYKEANGSGGKLTDLMPSIEENFGLTGLSDYEQAMLEDAFNRTMKGEEAVASKTQDYLLYGGYNPLSVTLTHLLNQRAGLAWTSYSHTGVPVATFALGIGQDLFNGYYDNTDIFKKMSQIMF